MIIPELVDAGPMKGSGGSVRRATQQVNSIDTLVAIKTSATGKERTSAEAAAAVEIDLLSSELVGCCGEKRDPSPACLVPNLDLRSELKRI